MCQFACMHYTESIATAIQHLQMQMFSIVAEPYVLKALYNTLFINHKLLLYNILCMCFILETSELWKEKEWRLPLCWYCGSVTRGML